MPIADKKKAKTIINLFRDLVTVPLVEANSKAETIRAAIVANGLQAQYSPGELSAWQDFVTKLDELVASPVVAAMEARYSETHRAKALIIGGVNDG